MENRGVKREQIEYMVYGGDRQDVKEKVEEAGKERDVFWEFSKKW
jgi:hypothetical protein